MAEPLSIVASVVGISAAGFKVAQGLYHIADSIGSAGEEVRLFAADADVFSHMLYGLSQALESSSTQSPRLLVTTEDAVRLCDQILQPFQRIIARLNLLLLKYRESRNKLKQVGLRIKWVWKHKSKLVFYQKMLNSLKGTLSCLLASLNISAATETRTDRAAILRLQLQNARGVVQHTSEATVSNILELETPVTRDNSDHSLPMNTLAAYEKEAEDTDDEGLLMSRNDMFISSSRNIISNSQTTAATDSDDGLECLIDEDLGGSEFHGTSGREVAALFEDIRSLQRQVIRFADESLAKSPNPDPSKESTSEGGASASESTTRNENATDTTTHWHGVMPPTQYSSAFTPYQCVKSDQKMGLSLTELREKNLILIEDTCGVVHYVSTLSVNSWGNLRRFINDLYAFKRYEDFKYSLSGGGAQGVARPEEPYAYTEQAFNAKAGLHYLQEIDPNLGANFRPGLHYRILSSQKFTTEHGTTLVGKESEYARAAFLRTISSDEFRLEDRSGNARHPNNIFWSRNWGSRTWLNAQLLLRFDNTYFNEYKVRTP